MKILIFISAYLPGYKAGGPIRTIANLVDALGDEFDFRIVTMDRDATDAEPYPGLDMPGEWKSVGKAQVLYLPPRGRSLIQIARILRETPHDILYLNSFFDPVFTIQPLVARRVGLVPRVRCVIAPRGEFSPGALGLKAWKKRLFLLAARVAGLYRGLVWQASTVHEEADILRVMKSDAANMYVAIDLPGPPMRNVSTNHRPVVDGAPLRVCFLSRISPMKNLRFALEVLAKVKVPVQFHVYGVIDNAEYWARCRPLMESLPENIVAVYHGSISHDDVASALVESDIFFLPTRGENFVHVLLEAWSAGLPVLTSDQTPWRQIESEGVGWAIPLAEPQRFVEVIGEVSKWTNQQRSDCRKKCIAFAERHRLDGAAIEANREMFSRVNGGASD